ncbi:MAG: DNA cytosine methyltransferase [Methylococcales bacterium]
MRAVDLFCGTGGFSRGAIAAGFDVVAAFDIDPNLTYSHHHNFPDTKLYLDDVSQLTGTDVIDKTGGDIDLMFGGPPCQGFSMMGKRQADDPRRQLLDHFFRLVSEVKPAAFVMENVEGLLFGEAKNVLEDALQYVSDYTVLDPIVLDASEFGAATKRKRAFVFGYDPVRCAPITKDSIESLKTTPATVADALSGLQDCTHCGHKDGFDVWRLGKHVSLSDYAQQLASTNRLFSGNQITTHTDKVVARFSTVAQGRIDNVGRHPRLKLDGQCPTLRAGTGSDRGSHQSLRPIHPTEDRVIRVREAARLQGFPDQHRFHPTIWHSFRQIGNSVSPIIAQKVLSVVSEKILANVAERKAA